MAGKRIALPNQLAQQLNNADQMAMVQAQMRKQEQLLNEQRQLEHQIFVERFIHQTAREIYTGLIISRELHPDETETVDQLAQDCRALAIVLARNLQLIMPAAETESKECPDDPNIATAD